MKVTIFVVFLLVFSCGISYETFAEYYESVGRELPMCGPYSWQKLGIALNERTSDDLIYAYRMRDKSAFTAVLESFDVLRVTNNTRVLVLDEELLKGRARVVITNGMYKGMSGWVPIEWIKVSNRSYRYEEEAKKNNI